MALRIPLVQVGGQIEQLQSGDTIATGAGNLTLTNANAGSIVIGEAVYVSTNDTVDLARANASGTKDVVGLVNATSISASGTGSILVDDGAILTATTGQWDVVTGQTGGLTAGSLYYLSAATAGHLTTTAPSSVGQYVAPVGIAVSTTEMKLTVKDTILL